MKENFEIPYSNKEYLIGKIEKLNKKARKLDCEEMILTFGKKRTVDISLSLEIERLRSFVEVELNYEIPIIDGWEFISKFDIYQIADKDPVVMTSTNPDKILPEKFHNKKSIFCDHCGHNRYRVKSYLLRNVDSGEYKEVGSGCVKDFFGHNPKNLIWLAGYDFGSLIDNVNDFESSRGKGFDGYGLFTVLKYSSAVIKGFGWISKSKAYEKMTGSTADIVDINLWPKESTDKNIIFTPGEEDEKLAREVINFFKTFKNEGNNEYFENIKKLTEIEFVPNKHFGLAVSIIPAYNNILNKLRKEKEKENLPSSNWIGKVGEKTERKVKCIYTNTFHNDYGYGGSTLLAIFKDESENILKTFYSGNKWDTERDEEGILKGTIKAHDEYKGEKNTVLTRANFIS